MIVLTAFLSVILYLIVLVGISTGLYFLLTLIWDTQEPILAYLMALIFTQLLISTIGNLKKN